MCFVTLKRKGSSDIVRQTHVRSASGGGDGVTSNGVEILGGTSLKEPFSEDSADREGNAPSVRNSAGDSSPSSTFRRGDSGRSSGGSGPAGRRGSWGGNVSTISSLEDAAQRIAVDPDTGHSFFVERSTVCDACPYCEDVCEVPWCNGCEDRRAHLEEMFGPLMPSTPGLEKGCGGTGAAAGGGRIRRVGSQGRMDAPALSRRYPRKSSYTPCEVRRRKLTGACWVVCQGWVYDVTDALEDHPGGKRSVLRNAGGRDCAEDFFFHSKAAKKQWRKYRIGSLTPCSGEKGLDGGEGDGERSMRTGSDCVIS